MYKKKWDIKIWRNNYKWINDKNRLDCFTTPWVWIVEYVGDQWYWNHYITLVHDQSSFLQMEKLTEQMISSSDDTRSWHSVSKVSYWLTSNNSGKKIITRHDPRNFVWYGVRANTASFITIWYRDIICPWESSISLWLNSAKTWRIDDHCLIKWWNKKFQTARPTQTYLKPNKF